MPVKYLALSIRSGQCARMPVTVGMTYPGRAR